MSAEGMERIDVLAVMDRAIVRANGGYAGNLATELIEARAAVAELVEAADEVARTGQGMFRLRRALARIGGAA